MGTRRITEFRIDLTTPGRTCAADHQIPADTAPGWGKRFCHLAGAVQGIVHQYPGEPNGPVPLFDDHCRAGLPAAGNGGKARQRSGERIFSRAHRDDFSLGGKDKPDPPGAHGISFPLLGAQGQGQYHLGNHPREQGSH